MENTTHTSHTQFSTLFTNEANQNALVALLETARGFEPGDTLTDERNLHAASMAVAVSAYDLLSMARARPAMCAYFDSNVKMSLSFMGEMGLGVHWSRRDVISLNRGLQGLRDAIKSVTGTDTSGNGQNAKSVTSKNVVDVLKAIAKWVKDNLDEAKFTETLPESARALAPEYVALLEDLQMYFWDRVSKSETLQAKIPGNYNLMRTITRFAVDVRESAKEGGFPYRVKARKKGPEVESEETETETE